MSIGNHTMEVTMKTVMSRKCIVCLNVFGCKTLEETKECKRCPNGYTSCIIKGVKNVSHGVCPSCLKKRQGGAEW